MQKISFSPQNSGLKAPLMIIAMMTIVMIVVTTLSLPECPDFNLILSNLDCSSHQNCRHANLFSDPGSQVSHLWGHSIQRKKLNCHVASRNEKLDIVKVQHLSLVSYINLFEQGRPTTLGDLLNHLGNSFNPYLITSTSVPDRWIIPTEPLSASPPFEPQEPLLLPSC